MHFSVFRRKIGWKVQNMGKEKVKIEFSLDVEMSPKVKILGGRNLFAKTGNLLGEKNSLPSLEKK